MRDIVFPSGRGDDFFDRSLRVRRVDMTDNGRGRPPDAADKPCVGAQGNVANECNSTR